MWLRVGHRRHAHSLSKISFAKLEKKYVKRIVNPYTKRYANPFETDESVTALAAPEFLIQILMITNMMKLRL